MTSLDEYYQTLGLSPQVSIKEVKIAYRQLVKRWHPDNFPHDRSQQQEAEEVIKRINQAYEILIEEREHSAATPKKKVDPQPYYARGVALAKSGDRERAIAELTKAILIDPEYLEAYLYRGFLYEKIGQRIRAEKDFNRATQVKREGTGYATPKQTAPTPATSAPPPAAKASPWQCVGTFEKHADVVSGIAVAPDGKFFASSSYDRSVVLWQLTTGRVLKTLKGHFDRVYCVAISPDSKFVASGSDDNNIKLWKASSGEELRTCGGWFGGHRERVLAVAFSPNKKKLLSGSGDRTVKIWRARTGQEIRTVKGYAAAVLAIAVSADAKVFASASAEKSLRIREMDGCLVRSLRVSSGVLAIAFSPDSRTLAVGCVDGSLSIWNWHEGKQCQTLSGHRDRICTLAFSADGKTLASGSWDRQIRLWDWQKGTEIAVLSGHRDRVCAVAFSPDGKTLVSGSGDRSVKIWWQQVSGEKSHGS